MANFYCFEQSLQENGPCAHSIPLQNNEKLELSEEEDKGKRLLVYSILYKRPPLENM
jgi:hypothetical protein